MARGPSLSKKKSIATNSGTPLSEPGPKRAPMAQGDIASQRDLELALQESEERYRAIVEKAYDAIVIVNFQEKIVYANPRVLTYFGYNPDELMGKPLELLIPELARKAHHAHLKSYLNNPQSRPMGAGRELFGRRRDGTEIPIDISLNPIATGGETLVTAIIRDISETMKLSNERKEALSLEKEARAYAEHAKLEAERANETKDIFLATLSHELRTPLTAILLWSQLLKSGVVNPEKMKLGLDTIERNALAQSQLINDLLDISRIHSGKLSLSITEIAPSEFVKAAIESVRPTAEAKKIAIELIDDANIGMVRGDPARLKQVIWNLMTNAIKFSPPGNEVKVHIDEAQENGCSYASIRVVDHGKGIDQDFLPNIFARFSQQDSASTRLHGGLGIGLALVHDLVGSHSGRVKAESAGPNQGATFTVLLPLVHAGEELTMTSSHESKRALPRPDLSGLKVLIVDDEPTSLEAFTEIVRLFGGEPIPCSSARQALIALKKLQPDILVSDIAMPLEDGYELIRKIRALKPGEGGSIPALALTAYANGDRTRSIEAGFQAHMTKPIGGEELGHMIARLITGQDDTV